MYVLNVLNKIMSSNNDFLFDIDADTQLSHTSAKDQMTQIYLKNKIYARRTRSFFRNTNAI